MKRVKREDVKREKGAGPHHVSRLHVHLACGAVGAKRNLTIVKTVDHKGRHSPKRSRRAKLPVPGGTPLGIRSERAAGRALEVPRRISHPEELPGRPRAAVGDPSARPSRPFRHKRLTTIRRADGGRSRRASHSDLKSQAAVVEGGGAFNGDTARLVLSVVRQIPFRPAPIF
jgi:hypothetical protein